MNPSDSIQSSQSKILFRSLALTVLVSCWTAVALESYLPLGIPALAVLIYLTIVDIKSIFFILLASIPISTEFELANGFSTDLPTEPLIVGLMLVYILYILKNGWTKNQAQQTIQFMRHPITLLLLLHVGWIFITMLNSESIFFSIKYFIAKIWYVATFYFLASLMLRSNQDFKQFFRYIFIPLSIAVVVTLYRHAAYSFSFEDVNKVMYPMFRNHVSYGCMMAVFFPFVIQSLTLQKRFSLKWWVLVLSVIIFLVATQYSYTRAAYGALLGAIGYYFIIKWRLTKIVVGLSIIASIGFITFIVNDNKYLDYAPKYEKTITHTHFDNLLEATAKGEDISTMERVYRWVAGFRMIADKPYMGFGPNNFFNFYKSYTVTDFKTYVSDNPEGSTVHCYYLLVAIEQGIPGALIFLFLVFFVLIKGEQVYHRAAGFRKSVTMTTLLSFVILLILILINDLIETDKFGSFFFISLAVITNFDLELKDSDNNKTSFSKDTF